MNARVKMRGYLKIRVVALLLVLYSLSALNAADILTSAENAFFPKNSNTRIGIEVEFAGIHDEEAADIVAAQVGGVVVKKTSTIKTTLKEELPDGTKIYNEIEVPYYMVKNSRIGNVVLKPEGNQTSDEDEPDLKKNKILELVTEPIRYPQVVELQKALTALKEAGAKGTSNTRAVATQVNEEIGEGKPENIKSKDVVNLLRSYLRPEHADQIRAQLEIPPIRQQFIKSLSPGFMKRLLDPKYSPSKRELYDDYIYRQSMELLGDKHSWIKPIAEVRKDLLAQENPIVPDVVKLNPLRISSLLMFLFPNDPMSKKYTESGWAVARPLVEFREWNTDFNIVGPVRQAIGLTEASKNYGYFDHDKLMAGLSGVDVENIQDLRKKASESSVRNPILFRYFLGDSDTVDKSEYHDQMKYFNGTNVGFLPALEIGAAPLVIPGESIVFHRRPIHSANVLGKYNPGLINANLQQALENKYTEFKFWNEFAPGSMPLTESLANLYDTKEKDVQSLVKSLKKRFPNGWVMKGVWDLGTEKDIITDGTDVASELEKYLKSDFDKFREKLVKQYSETGVAPEYVLMELKKHPNYKGYQIAKYLKNADLTIIQEKLPIDREFRVEILGGKVLGHGSTIDRWWYAYNYGYYGLKMKDYVPPSKDDVKKIEDFAQSMIDKLPPELRGTPFGADIALLKNGKVAMIESNPGGNSNFLYEEEKESVHALERFMRKFPAQVKDGEVHLGLSPTEQMSFLSKMFKKWKVDTTRLYPKMQFLKDQIVDPEMENRTLSDRDIGVSPAQAKRDCRAFFKRMLGKPGIKTSSLFFLFRSRETFA